MLSDLVRYTLSKTDFVCQKYIYVYIYIVYVDFVHPTQVRAGGGDAHGPGAVHRACGGPATGMAFPLSRSRSLAPALSLPLCLSLSLACSLSLALSPCVLSLSLSLVVAVGSYLRLIDFCIIQL